MNSITPREAAIVIYLASGMSIMDIAKKFDVTHVRVKQIVGKLQGKLSNACEHSTTRLAGGFRVDDFQYSIGEAMKQIEGEAA